MHFIDFAEAFALLKAGMSKAASIAIIAMQIRSSINVKNIIFDRLLGVFTKGSFYLIVCFAWTMPAKREKAVRNGFAETLRRGVSVTFRKVASPGCSMTVAIGFFADMFSPCSYSVSRISQSMGKNNSFRFLFPEKVWFYLTFHVHIIWFY